MGLRQKLLGWKPNRTILSGLSQPTDQCRSVQHAHWLCAEWDLIKMQVSALWNTVRHNQENQKSTMFSPYTINTFINLIKYTLIYLIVKHCVNLALQNAIQIGSNQTLGWHMWKKYSWTQSCLKPSSTNIKNLCFLSLNTSCKYKFYLHK